MEREIYFKDFSYEELRKLQLKLTDILNEIDRFCRDQGLTYFLSAGTCIGAVRHKGFIPWDDDLDICLPRKDYERLTEIWNKCHPDGKYVLYRPGKDVLTGVHITLIKDSTTTCVYKFSKQYNICQGIKVDVEPLDGSPDCFIGQVMQTFFANLYGLFAAQRVPVHNQPTWKKIVARIVLPVFHFKKLCYWVFSMADKQVQKYDLEKCKKVKWNYGAYHSFYDRDMFLPVVEMEFEGKPRFVPHNYDAVLKLAYGDYMTLPPKEKRYPSTCVLAYDLNRSYEEYLKIHPN